MLSRVANSIYWLNRYIERAENYARFIGVNFNLLLDTNAVSSPQQWMPLLASTADESLFASLYPEPTADNIFLFLTFDERNPNAIYSCVKKARENARTIRESISIEMWEHINSFYHSIRSVAEQAEAVGQQPRDFLREVVQGSQLLIGIEDTTISHTEGWHFGRLGRYIERADKTARILDAKYFTLLPPTEEIGSVADLLQWSAVLKSVSAFMMYRRRHGQLSAPKIIEFMIMDKHFPRSVYYCLAKAQQILGNILKMHRSTHRTPVMRKIAVMVSELHYTTPQEIIQYGMHAYIDRLQTTVNEVNDELYRTFFSPKD